MKILYGVQGTGNGHITRARRMAQTLRQYDIQVDFVFSGKDGDYFNMDVFGVYRTYRGLSFVAENGRIQYWKTLKRNHLKQFWRDVCTLDVSAYDLVISDFEPITAWAAKRQKKYCLGLSHQNAFRFKVPVQGANPIGRAVLNYMAPATDYIGLHWHHFNGNILPPIIKTDLRLKQADSKKILVYLPFLRQAQHQDLFHCFSEYRFVQYHPVTKATVLGNVEYRPLSREAFLDDFADCGGIICSAGFGACSEAIHYGKKLLVLPLQGQMEQLSNAAALHQLGYGRVVDKLNRQQLSSWLQQASPEATRFPDVAGLIVAWLVAGRPISMQQLVHQTWDKVARSPAYLKPQSLKVVVDGRLTASG